MRASRLRDKIGKFFLLRILFSIIYRKWLWNDFHKNYDKVIIVRGWRLALVDSKCGGRRTMSPVFWFETIEIPEGAREDTEGLLECCNPKEEEE